MAKITMLKVLLPPKNMPILTWKTNSSHMRITWMIKATTLVDKIIQTIILEASTNHNPLTSNEIISKTFHTKNKIFILSPIITNLIRMTSLLFRIIFHNLRKHTNKFSTHSNKIQTIFINLTTISRILTNKTQTITRIMHLCRIREMVFLRIKYNIN